MTLALTIILIPLAAYVVQKVAIAIERQLASHYPDSLLVKIITYEVGQDRK